MLLSAGEARFAGAAVVVDDAGTANEGWARETAAVAVDGIAADGAGSVDAPPVHALAAALADGSAACCTAHEIVCSAVTAKMETMWW